MRTSITSGILILFIISLFYGCTDELGTHTITYQLATPIYEHRSNLNQEISLEGPREINDISKVYIGDGFLFVGEQDKGIHLIDNEDNQNPFSIGFLPIRTNKEFFVDGDILYADSFADLLKINIADPKNPEILFRLENAFIENELMDNQGRVLTGFTYEEKVISASDADRLYQEYWADNRSNYVYQDYQYSLIPNSALPVSFTSSSDGTSGTANRMAKYQDFLYTISYDKLSLFREFGDQNDIIKHGNSFDLRLAETMYIQDETMFIGTRIGVELRNLSVPTSPELISTHDHAEACDPVLPHGDVAYVTLRSNDDCGARDLDLLVTLDIQNTFNPIELQEYQMKAPYGMAIIESTLYVAEGLYGISAFDITNPKSPSFLHRISDIEAYDLLSDPKNPSILLVATPKGLRQYRIGANDSKDLSLLSVIGN